MNNGPGRICRRAEKAKLATKREWLEATEALKIAGLTPLTLAAKEGLALLNCIQVSTAYALRGLFEGEDLFAGALAIGGLTVEALLASRSPFDARIHAARGQKGQITPLQPTVACSVITVKSLTRIKIAARSRIPTPCVASRKSWARA